MLLNLSTVFMSFFTVLYALGYKYYESYNWAQTFFKPPLLIAAGIRTLHHVVMTNTTLSIAI